MGFIIVLAVMLFFILISSIRILQEYERGVLFTLGRFERVVEPGLRIVLPAIQRMDIVSTRVMVLDVPPQDIITQDNISVRVNAVVYFRAITPEKTILNVENYMYATSQIAQTTLRSILGQQDLDDLLTNREKINKSLQEILDHRTESWGIKVSSVEVKNVDIPESMQRAIAKQAEAERERRAKVIHADGEFQAAQKLADAAKIIGAEPAALQLRYLQTLTEVSNEKSSTTIFPFPMDLLDLFMKKK